jgi:hypothetical protein
MEVIMKSGRFAPRVFGIVALFWIMVLMISSSAQATNGCYKYITFKNQGAYIARATVSYKLDGHDMSQQTGNFPAGQERRVSMPCSATSVKVIAHAVGGHDIFSRELGNAQDRCFKLKGATLNTGYESCDPPGTTPVEVSNCYKHITIKNNGAYVVDATVSYKYNNLSSSHPTGHFSAGVTKRVAVPCDATNVCASADVVDPLFVGISIFGSCNEKAADRCFLLRGTHLDNYYETCDPSESLPPVTCWKHITLKNESAYVMVASVSYNIGGSTKMATTGSFPTGKVKTIAVPCDSSSDIEAGVVAGKPNIMRLGLEKNKDYCFIFRGTTWSPRYEPCVKPPAAAPPPQHTITIRNNGAYATELTVNYDLNYQRKSAKKVIQTQKHGELSIPIEAKNVQVTARAIGGERIFETVFQTGQSYCREVIGTTLITKHGPCN